MLDKDIEVMMDKGAEELEGETSPSETRDEVQEASDTSFPASDPPAFTSAPPRKRVREAELPKQS